MREPLPPPPMIADVMADEGISWSRFVTAIVLLALSLAIGYRTGREPPRQKAVPQPVRESVVAGVELAPLVRAPPAAPEAPETAPEPASAEPAPAAGQAQRPGGAQPRQADRATKPSAGTQAVRVRRHHVLVATRSRGARAGVRTRAQVRAEFLRSRAVVAALTGEDSGSAYLMRVAAQRDSRRRAR